jgi:ElaB/YqjD/DUF883 family membrane-anchored ribosome-binding protein
MSNDIQSIIDRVHKLLSLSNSTNVHEAAAAAAVANRLIDQHRLTLADLEKPEQDSVPLVEDAGYVYTSGKVTPWKTIMLHNLVAHYGLYHYNDSDYSNGRKVSRFKLVGRQDDIAVCRYMFAWLVTECQRLSDSEAKGFGKIFAASYCEGFVQGVNTQLKLSREEIKKTATITSIVKIDARQAEAKGFAFKTVKGLHTVKAKSARRMDNFAFQVGKTRGENISLSKTTKILGN